MTEQRVEQRERVQKMSRVRWCAVCLRFTAHGFHGYQRFPTRTLALYNRVRCSATVAEPI